KDSWGRAEAAAAAPVAVKEAPAAPAAPPAERTPRTAAQEARFALYTRERGLNADDADRIARDDGLAEAFVEALAVHPNASTIANWLVNELARELKDRPLQGLPFGGTEIGELVALLDADK